MALECDECWRKHMVDKWRKVTFFQLLYCDKWIYYSNLRHACKCVCLHSIGLDALRATVSLPDHLQRNTFIKREPAGAPAFQSTYYSSFLRTNWATGFDCDPSLQVAFVDPGSLLNKSVPPFRIDPCARQLDSPDNAITWSHESIAPDFNIENALVSEHEFVEPIGVLWGNLGGFGCDNQQEKRRNLLKTTMTEVLYSRG